MSLVVSLLMLVLLVALLLLASAACGAAASWFEGQWVAGSGWWWVLQLSGFLRHHVQWLCCCHHCGCFLFGVDVIHDTGKGIGIILKCIVRCAVFVCVAAVAFGIIGEDWFCFWLEIQAVWVMVACCRGALRPVFLLCGALWLFEYHDCFW